MFSGQTDITMPLGAAGDDSPQPRRHQEISVIVQRKDLPAQTSMVCGPVIVFAMAMVERQGRGLLTCLIQWVGCIFGNHSFETGRMRFTVLTSFLAAWIVGANEFGAGIFFRPPLNRLVFSIGNSREVIRIVRLAASVLLEDKLLSLQRQKTL